MIVALSILALTDRPKARRAPSTEPSIHTMYTAGQDEPTLDVYERWLNMGAHPMMKGGSATRQIGNWAARKPTCSVCDAGGACGYCLKRVTCGVFDELWAGRVPDEWRYPPAEQRARHAAICASGRGLPSSRISCLGAPCCSSTSS